MCQSGQEEGGERRRNYGSNQSFVREGAALSYLVPICIITQCAILISEFTAYWKRKVGKAIKAANRKAICCHTDSALLKRKKNLVNRLELESFLARGTL